MALAGPWRTNAPGWLELACALASAKAVTSLATCSGSNANADELNGVSFSKGSSSPENTRADELAAEGQPPLVVVEGDGGRAGRA